MIEITCARAICGLVKAVRKKDQRYCSHRCDILERPAARRREAGRRGGVASGARRWAQSMADWRALYPHVPPVLAREIYLRGYSAGSTAQRQRRKRLARSA